MKLTPTIAGNLGNLDNVSTAGAAAGDLLRFDGTNWVKFTPETVVVPLTFDFTITCNGDGTITGAASVASTATAWKAP